MIRNDLDRPSREPLAQRLREFFAFVIRGRYFWVRSIEGGCGEVFTSLDEAVEAAEDEFRLGVIPPVDGPLEVIEVRRRDRMRRVWCSEPTLMSAPIKTGREPGIDFFPSEWLDERSGSRASAQRAPGAPSEWPSPGASRLEKAE
jgi:hypothetical protein